MKIKLILFFTIVSVQMTFAQDARSILDKASETYSKAGGITASFSLDVEDTKNKTSYSQDGKAYMKGDKFQLDVPDAVTWFDGKTQWVYIKDSEEVSVSTPTGKELQSISPSAMFNIYKSGFNLANKVEKTIDGKRVHVVELRPQKNLSVSTEIISIELQIDKTTNIFTKITIVYTSGYKNIVSIRNVQQGVSLGDDMFQFNKSKYPDAEVIDLR